MHIWLESVKSRRCLWYQDNLLHLCQVILFYTKCTFVGQLPWKVLMNKVTPKLVNQQVQNAWCNFHFPIAEMSPKMYSFVCYLDIFMFAVIEFIKT